MSALVNGDRWVPWATDLAITAPLAPLKYEVSINAMALPETTDPDRLLRYIDIGSIDSFGKVSSVEEFTFSNAPSRARRLPRAGDTIVSTVRTYLRAISYIETEDPSLVCSTGFAVITAGKRLDSSYLAHWMRSDPVVDEICARSTGVSYPAINASEIGCLPVPMLPLERQREVANFLDRKTAAIDALVAKKERLIELLQEKRQALITQAVTKGLDPNVPTKESRNPFLGAIPRQWESWSVRDLLRMRHLEVQDGNHGELHPVAADYVDDGIPFLMANNVRGGNVDLLGCKFIPQDLADGLRIGFAREGDVLLTHKGTLGETAILSSLAAPYAMLTPQVTYYRSRALFDRRYLYFFLTSEVLQEQLRFISSVQSTRGYVGITAQRDLVLLVPPVNEQLGIADYLEPRVRQIDNLRARIAQSIVGLRDYRQALITTAVTGKIDVSKEAA